MTSRRRYLAGLGAVGALLAGCLGDAPPDDQSSPTPGQQPATTIHQATPTTTRHPTQSEPTPGDTAMTFSKTVFRTTYQRCGEDATADIEITDSRLHLSGSLVASNPCHTAVLETARVEPDADRLYIEIDVRRNDDLACAECIGEIGFELDGEFHGGQPSTVTVELGGMRPSTVEQSH